MKHFIKVIIVAVILLSFYAGYFLGINGAGRPERVLPCYQMQNIWNEDAKILFQDEIIRKGIALDSEQGKLLLKQFHGDFEPMVFCHPFIILKQKDNRGYKVFINANIKYPGFDNLAGPTLEFSESKDNTGADCNEYIFSTPPRRTIDEEKISDFVALVKTDKENNRTSTVVNVTNVKKNEGFYYRDLDVDGVFESVVHVDTLSSADDAKKTQYSLTEFVEKFCSPVRSCPEILNSDSNPETGIEK
jgi:hypothetical protein